MTAGPSTILGTLKIHGAAFKSPRMVGRKVLRANRQPCPSRTIIFLLYRADTLNWANARAEIPASLNIWLRTGPGIHNGGPAVIKLCAAITTVPLSMLDVRFRQRLSHKSLVNSSSED